MFGTAQPAAFNNAAQTLATMISLNNLNGSSNSSSNAFLHQPTIPKQFFSPEPNLFSLLQEASRLQPTFLPSLQDLILQNTFINLLQAQVQAQVAAVGNNNNSIKIPVSPPPQISIPSPLESSRKRPSSSSSRNEEHQQLSAPPMPKRAKQMRKLASEDAETNSPVSGMHIKDMSEVSADDIAKAAELDETASFVVVSEETRRKLAEIPDVIKSTNCALCKVKFEDVIHLARHKCPRIVHEEYKCSECEKVFSCPANLASHKRWHGPRPQKGASTSPQSSTRESSSTPSESFQPSAIQLFSDSFLSPFHPKIEEVTTEIKVEI